MTSFIDALEMGREKDLSRIVEMELYLTKKIIDNRGTGYKPTEDDEDQHLRDKLKELRIKWGIEKKH